MQILGHETIVDQYLLDMKREINPSEEYVKLNRQVLKKLVGSDFKTISKYDILAILDKLRKPEESDPLHKWIGSYNLYIIILKRFFKWLGNPECMEGIKELKRKEKSIYKPSDMWTVEDDLLFLKYCNNKRDKCYHAISRDSSCRPSELLKLKVKDVLFKHANGKQYAEILVNGKTGTRHIPLINSIPYTKDWLDEYPFSNNPNASLISGLRQSLGKHINRKSLHETYDKYKKEYFPKLLDNPAIAPEEKKKIEILPNKPWNPYIRRQVKDTERTYTEATCWLDW